MFAPMTVLYSSRDSYNGGGVGRRPFVPTEGAMMCVRTKRAASALAVLSVILLVPPALHAQYAINRVTVVSAGDRGQPTVARIDAEGMIHVLSDAVDGPWYVRSTDGGATFSPPMAVVDSRSRMPELEFSVSDVAIGKGGRVHVVMSTNAWKLKLPRNESGMFYASIDPGGKEFSPLRNLNQSPSEGFSVAADDKGTVTACWLKDKLYANVSNNNGNTFAATVELDPAYNPCNCCTTSTVYGTDGKLAVLYREETNNERDMYLVLWDQALRQKTSHRLSSTLWSINACPMTYYAVAPNHDGFTAVWPTRGDVYFARLDGQGKVLPPGEIKTPGTTGMRTGILALNAPDGITLIAWKKDNQLGWQLYDATGRPTGRSGSTMNPGKGAAGVVDMDGHFILFR
jgi:hypothetical protein